MEIAGIVQQIIQERRVANVVSNPLAQFGTPERPLLGAELLPERLVPENVYEEEEIKFLTVVANAATRYSPVQRKDGGILVGSMLVKLAEMDVGSAIKGSHYDALIRLAQSAGDAGSVPAMDAMANIIRWLDTNINRPMTELNEVYRWQCMVDGLITRRGDGGYREDVQYFLPTGHRVTAGGDWDNNAYDPMLDFQAAKNFMATKGQKIVRAICGTELQTKLLGNTLMRSRVGSISIQLGTNIGLPGIMTNDQLTNILRSSELPPIETYDQTYKVQAAGGTLTTGYFLKRHTMVLVGQTDREAQIALNGEEPVLLPNTLGYLAVGRAVGQTGPGRVIKMRVYDDTKPPRIEGEGWQTSLPVIQEPESLYVITVPNV